MAALYTAASLTGLSTGVSAILVGFIGVGLLFVAKRFIGRAGVK